MRSIKLDLPTAPGEKRYNEGLAYGSCGGLCRVGSSLPGSQRKSSHYSGMLRSILALNGWVLRLPSA